MASSPNWICWMYSFDLRVLVVERVEHGGRRDHELDELPVGVLLEGHERRGELRREQVGDEVVARVGVLGRDAHVGELLRDQRVGRLAEQGRARHRDRQAVAVARLREQFLRLVGVVRVVVVERGVVGVGRLGEDLRGHGALVALECRQQCFAVERVVEGLAHAHVGERRIHGSRPVEQQEALEVELVGVHRPAGALDLGEVVVADQLDAVRLAGLDGVQRRRGVGEHVDGEAVVVLHVGVPVVGVLRVDVAGAGDGRVGVEDVRARSRRGWSRGPRCSNDSALPTRPGSRVR